MSKVAVASNYPTDLNPTESRIAEEQLGIMAAKFEAAGLVSDQRLLESFKRTPRHPYVPAFYPTHDSPPLLCIDGARRQEWLDAVYSDTTLITKVAPVALSRSLGPATGQVFVSSSTLPSLVLQMLELLDLADGHRVLEIGTGSGYNAALLCARIGAANVTTVDVDGELVDLAAERLAANGHRPTLGVGDGALGYPANAPYDRIISTCAVARIPDSWLTQIAPGGIILTDLHGRLGGTLVRLTANDDGFSEGRFVSYGTGFMYMRPPSGSPAAPRHDWIETCTAVSTTDVDPTPLTQHSLFGFVTQWHLPEANRGLGLTPDGRPALHLSTPDGSHATVATVPGSEGFDVIESGTRRLWREVEAVQQFWNKAGRPSFERFGVTANLSEQYVWLDDPHGQHRWYLPR